MNAQTLPGRVLEFAASRPAATALREKRLGVWQPHSWAEYAAEVAVTARAMANAGVGPGDAVAILSENRTEWLFADLAAQALGALSVGIYQTNPAPDVAYILTHSGAKLLVCEDQEQVDKALEVTAETPALSRIVVLEPRGTRDYDDARLVSWADFRADIGADLEWLAAQVAERDPVAPAMVVYTSGTTGPPKGALLSARNALDVADELVPLHGMTAEDQLLSYLPLCHVAEKIFSLFLPLTCGAVVHFGESIETVRQDLAEVSPTIFLGVPRIWEKMHASVTLKMKDSSWLKRTLFQRLTPRRLDIADRRRAGNHTALDRIEWLLGDALVFRALQERLGLRRCWYPVTGAAPIAQELVRWFHGVGVPVVEGYGQTECAGVCHINPPDAVRLGTVGTVLPTLECRIADDGEVLVRGNAVFCGYLHDPEATARTVVDGWLYTGDVGAEDADGYLRITGRKKEIIITAGGKNLSPEKIENALKLSPYVKEAVAVGDTRKFIGALVQIDADAVGDWARRRELTYTSYAELAAMAEVASLVELAVREANEHLARVEQVRAFRILAKELHQDDGELTATQKVRRREVMRIHEALVESIYG